MLEEELGEPLFLRVGRQVALIIEARLAAARRIPATFGVACVAGAALSAGGGVNVFPAAEAFIPGEEVLLFLIDAPDARAYTIASEFGAYRLKDGMAALMTKRAGHAARRHADVVGSTVR